MAAEDAARIEEFTSVGDFLYFYTEAVPPPWRRVPQCDFTPFNRTVVKEGKSNVLLAHAAHNFFEWRQSILQEIHRMVMPPFQKLSYVKARIDSSDTRAAHVRDRLDTISASIDGYLALLNALEEYFGGEQRIATKKLALVRSLPRLVQNDLVGLDRLRTYALSAQHYFGQYNLTATHSGVLLMDVQSKLPAAYMQRYAKECCEFQRDEDLGTLMDMLKRISYEVRTSKDRDEYHNLMGNPSAPRDATKPPVRFRQPARGSAATTAMLAGETPGGTSQGVDDYDSEADLDEAATSAANPEDRPACDAC